MDFKQAILLKGSDCDASWNDEKRGRLSCRTLFSADRTDTDGLTAGVMEIEAGDQLKRHRHSTHELYYVLAGTGILKTGDTEYEIGANSAIFIPSNSIHGLRDTGREPLRILYVFPVDSFEEVEYTFEHC